MVDCHCLIHTAALYFSTKAFNLSFEAPTSSSTFSPPLHTWKVGIALTPHSAATSCKDRLFTVLDYVVIAVPKLHQLLTST